MASGRPSIGTALHARVEAAVRERPELGYQTTSELIKDLLRRWLENQDGAKPAGSQAPEEQEKKTIGHDGSSDEKGRQA